MAENWTPGPWNWERVSEYTALQPGILLADYAQPEPSDANKALIAASPDLYAALKAIQQFCDDPQGGEKPETLARGLARLLPAARAALRKARGED